MISLPHHSSSSAAGADASAAAPGSASSTPRGGGGGGGGGGTGAAPPTQQQKQQVRLMCSFGGRILPRPHDHQLRYVGGETRIVSVPRSASFALLLSLLSKLLPPNHNPNPNPSPGSPPPIVKYQLPHEDLDALISVTSDEDVDNMMDELDRLSSSSSTSSSSSSSRTPRLRLFLFSSSCSSSSPSASSSSARTAAEPFGSVVDAGADKWFLDALNGTSAAPPHLERGRSEASSVVSEVPDYLFGLDTNSSDEPRFSSASSKPDPDDAPAEPDRPVQPNLPHHHGLGVPSYVGVNPVWHPEPAVPVYCVPAPVHGGSLPIRPVSVPVHYVASLGGQLPVGFAPPVRGGLLPGSFYVAGPPGAGGDRYEAAAGGGGVIVGPGLFPVYPQAPPPGGASMGAGLAGESPGIAGGDMRKASQ